MRYLLFVCLQFLLVTALSAQGVSSNVNSTEVSTQIEAVTVFQQGAQVTRGGDVRVGAGETVLAFTELTASLDQASLQVSSDAAVTVLSVVHRIDYLTPTSAPDSVAMLQTLLDAKRDSIRIARQTLDVYQQEQQLVLENRDLGGQDGVQVDELVAASDFLRERLLELNAFRRSLDKQLRRLQTEAQRLELQLNELGRRSAQQPQSTVEVKVRADRPVDATFTVRYRVQQAGWRAAYDLRVASVEDPASLTYAANVYQRTSEAWTDVALTLSTGDPNRSTVIPELYPWRIGFERPVARKSQSRQASRADQGAYAANPSQVRGRVLDIETGVPLMGATVRVVQTNQGTSVDGRGEFMLALPGGSAGQLLEASFVGYQSVVAPIQSEVVTFYLAPAFDQLDEVMMEAAPLRSRAETADFETAAQPTQRQRQATTTTFALDVPYTIPPDGKTHRVEIASHRIPAEYRYTSVPKYDESAFLTAGITGWSALDLISGPASLFFEGTYLGTTALDIANTTDTLSVSLGQDPGVVVERELDTQYAERNFLRNRVTDQRGYVIKVRNNKSVPIALTLEDQVPLSTDERIDVELVERSGARFEASTGILTWDLVVPPNSLEEVTFRYAVTYPRGERISLE